MAVYLEPVRGEQPIRRHKRPEYIAHRDFTPIECLPDDCLLKDYPVDLPPGRMACPPAPCKPRRSRLTK